MSDIAGLTTAVNALTAASQANAQRWNDKLTALQAALAAAQAAGVVVPDDLVAAIAAVTASLDASPAA